LADGLNASGLAGAVDAYFTYKAARIFCNTNE